MTINFAHITNNKVDNIIVATQEFINELPNSNEWVSFYTDALGEQEKKYNGAGIGCIFDSNAQAFFPPSPFPSWYLDGKFVWQPPSPKPVATETHDYFWDEDSLSWVAEEIIDDEIGIELVEDESQV